MSTQEHSNEPQLDIPDFLTQDQARAACEAGYLPLRDYIKLCDAKGWQPDQRGDDKDNALGAALGLILCMIAAYFLLLIIPGDEAMAATIDAPVIRLTAYNLALAWGVVLGVPIGIAARSACRAKFRMAFPSSTTPIDPNRPARPPMYFNPRWLTASMIAGISKFNVRRDDVEQDGELDSLAGMLAATNGWLNPIVVVNDDYIDTENVIPDNEPYHVLAGRRRWRAINRAFELGLLPPTMKLTVSVFEGTALEAREISLMENIGHKPMTPVEEVCAFRDCANAGSSPAEIAKTFGLDLRTVEARLALAHLHPYILEAWRDQSITQKAAQAYCSELDPAKQLALWSGSPGIRDNPAEIRKRLRGDSILATSALAVFVGADAYTKAGGVIDGDLFESDVWWKDPGIAQDLARQKLQAHGDKIKAAEGWGWVRTQYDADAIGLQNFKEDAANFTAGEIRDMDEISAALTRGDGDTAANLARLAEMEAKGWARGITKARRAKLGILVQINQDGSEIEVDRALETKAMRESREEKADRTPVEKISGTKVTAIIPDEIGMPDLAASVEEGKADFVFSEAAETAVAALVRREYGFAITLLLVAFTRDSLDESLGFEAACDLPSIRSDLHRKLRMTENFRDALALAKSAGSDERGEAFLDIVACAFPASERPHHVDMALCHHGEKLDGWEFTDELSGAFDAEDYVAALPLIERDQIAADAIDLSPLLPECLHDAVRQAANDGAAVLAEDDRSAAQAMVDAIDGDEAAGSGAVPDLAERFAHFADASIIAAPDQRIKAQLVFDAYNAFAAEQGWPTSGPAGLGPVIAERGIEKHRHKTGVQYLGIALRQPEGV